MGSGVMKSETPSGHDEMCLLLQPTFMIVEDQALIALSLEAYLEDAGFGDCETFPSGAEALSWLVSHTPTVAILDFSLRDGPCTRLVRVLRERGIPCVIYSGQTRDVAPPELRDVPWLSKPCETGRRSWRRWGVPRLLEPGHTHSLWLNIAPLGAASLGAAPVNRTSPQCAA
jgi:CheY-like chemotaxis protein